MSIYRSFPSPSDVDMRPYGIVDAYDQLLKDAVALLDRLDSRDATVVPIYADERLKEAARQLRETTIRCMKRI